MGENLGVTIEAILRKLEKLEVIELQLKEVHAKEDWRLDSEIHVLKSRTTKLEKNVEELEEGFQYNEDDVRDLQRDNRKLEHEVYDLKKQLFYMETYSRRENLKFFGIPENTECTMEEGSQQGVAFENTREVMHNSWKRNLWLNDPARK